MKRFERFRCTVGLSLDQAARLWAEGVRTPEELLRRAARQEGRAALRRHLDLDRGRVRALVAYAREFLGRDASGARPPASRRCAADPPAAP